MEKQGYVVNGGVKMPVGFRFHPTDEEVVVHYLKRKSLGLPLPASIIPELDVFHTDPWSLPGDLKENRYFFSNRQGAGQGKYCKKVAGSGYWKPIGKERPILSSLSNQAIGMRRTLVYSEGKRSCGTKTARWFMYQYRLVDSATLLDSTKNFGMEWLENWSVHRVFQKKRKAKKQVGNCELRNSNITQITAVNSPSCLDLTMEECSGVSPPQPSSSTSEITEVDSNGLEQEESSGCITSCSNSSCMREGKPAQ